MTDDDDDQRLMTDGLVGSARDCSVGWARDGLVGWARDGLGGSAWDGSVGSARDGLVGSARLGKPKKIDGERAQLGRLVRSCGVCPTMFSAG